MNTVNFYIPYERKDVIRGLQQDLRRWKIRHYPFSHQPAGIEIKMFPNAKTSLVLLKYG